MEYKTLNKLNPKIDLNNIKETLYLYCGGEAINKNASYFIAQAQGESTQQYTDRLALLSYKNYFGQIVDSITSKIFENEIKVLAEDEAENEYFSDFQNENDLTEILRDITTNNLLFVSSFLHINWITEDGSQRDFPKLEVIPNDVIINYKKNQGKITEIVIKTLEEDPDKSCLIPERFFYQFLVYSMQGAKVQRGIYKTEQFKLAPQQKSKPTQLFGLSALGAGAKFSDNQAQNEKKDYKIEFQEIIYLDLPELPVVELTFKHGLSLGNKLAPIAKEILEDYSQLRSFYHTALHPIAVLKAAGISEAESFNDAFGSEDRDRSPLAAYKSQGFSKIMKDDELSYLEAKGTIGAQVFEHIENLHSTMYLLSWQTIIAPKQSVQKSGISKSLDEKQKDIIISTISTKIKKYLDDVIIKILSIIGKEDIDICIMGLDFSSEHIDRDTVLQEAVLVQSIGVLGESKTFKSNYYLNLAETLLGSQSDKELIEEIKNEIEKGVDEQKEQKDLLFNKSIQGQDNSQPFQKGDK